MNVVSALTGKGRMLDGKLPADESATEQDVTDAPKLARLLTRVLRDLASLRRSFVPRRTDFEDVDVDATGTKKFYFSHGFEARVRWWVIDTSVAHGLSKHVSTDSKTLVLVSTVACRLTVRVEEAG